jgi:uncharacterized protein YbjQ (UPF0145 family)
MDDGTGMETFEWGVILLVYGLPVIGLIFFGFIGAHVERSHYASIRAREAATGGLPITASRILDATQTVADARLVSSSVVISQDYFKRFLANLRTVFGGRIRSYETLMDRARREALLRLKEQCPDASVLANLRLETSAIAKASGNKGVIAVEVLAYATAVRYAGPVPTAQPPGSAAG